MKRLLLFMILLVPLLLSGQISDTLNVTDSKGLRQGLWEKKDKEGRLVYSGSFVNNHQEGWFSYFDATGKLKRKMLFSDEGRRAFAQMVYPDGKVMSEGWFWEQKKDSLWKYYTSSGLLSFTEFYRQGVKEGKWDIFDREGVVCESIVWQNGEKREEYKNFYTRYTICPYEQGVRHGRFQEFLQNGNLYIEGSYHQGVRHGKWTTFFKGKSPVREQQWETGSLRSEKLILIDGKRIMKVPTDEIALFYRHKTGTKVVSLNGQEYETDFPTDQLADLLNIDEFLMVNRKQQFFCRYTCMQWTDKASGGPGKLKFCVTLPSFLSVDEEGMKALQSILLAPTKGVN